MEKKLTPVEWLHHRLQTEPFLTNEDFETAKAMEGEIPAPAPSDAEIEKLALGNESYSDSMLSNAPIVDDYMSCAMFLIGYLRPKPNIQKKPTDWSEIIYLSNVIKKRTKSATQSGWTDKDMCEFANFMTSTEAQITANFKGMQAMLTIFKTRNK